MGWLLPLLVVGLALGAEGQGYYLEAPAYASRSEAARVARVASAEGMRSRVVRRYRHGTGWEYVARVEGLVEHDAAVDLASTLARQAGVPVRVFAVDGSIARSVERASPELPVAETAHEEIPMAEADTEALLLGAVRAHGGSAGGAIAVDRAPEVLFRFRRHLPDGGVVAHTWARRGQARFLEVRVDEGEGVDSRMLLVPGEGAWLARGSATPEARDSELVARQLERFSPASVLGLSLTLPAVARGSVAAGADVVLPKGGECAGLALETAAGAHTRLCLDPDSHLLRGAVVGEGSETAYGWSGYRAVEVDLLVPVDARTWRGDTLVDRVEIIALELSPELPDEWFDTSAM